MSTPSYIATRLRADGWSQVSEDNWQRPGNHADIHSWPVANLIARLGEPHHEAPRAFDTSMPRLRKPGFQMRGSNRSARSPSVPPSAPRRGGQPRKTDLIRRVVAMHDGQRMTFRAIAAEIGGKASRVHYLYSQAGKLQTAGTATP